MKLYLLQKHCRSVAGNFHNTNEKGKKEKKKEQEGEEEGKGKQRET